MATANSDGAAVEWDELPVDGSDAWCGLLLLAGSGVVSVKMLAWAFMAARSLVML